MFEDTLVRVYAVGAAKEICAQRLAVDRAREALSDQRTPRYSDSCAEQIASPPASRSRPQSLVPSPVCVGARLWLTFELREPVLMVLKICFGAVVINTLPVEVAPGPRDMRPVWPHSCCSNNASLPWATAPAAACVN